MDFYGKDKKDIMELVNLGVAMGGYSSSGWKHDVLVEIAKEAGFSASREEHLESEEDGLEDILAFLKSGSGVMVSAIKNFSETTKFHMVLLTGFESDSGEIKGFYYHDPDSVDKDGGKHRFVHIETFKKYWRKMAIYVNM